jgi:hypothetical protein
VTDRWKGRAWLAAGDAAFVLGLVLLAMASLNWTHVIQFRSAAACGTRSPATNACYQTAPATVADEVISGGRRSQLETLTLDFGTSTEQVDVDLNDSIDQGATVIAKFYQGKITDVIGNGQDAPTYDNPQRQLGDTIWFGLGLTALGGLAVTLQIQALQRRRHQQLTPVTP